VFPISLISPSATVCTLCSFTFVCQRFLSVFLFWIGKLYISICVGLSILNLLIFIPADFNDVSELYQRFECDHLEGLIRKVIANNLLSYFSCIIVSFTLNWSFPSLRLLFLHFILILFIPFLSSSSFSSYYYSASDLLPCVCSSAISLAVFLSELFFIFIYLEDPNVRVSTLCPKLELISLVYLYSVLKCVSEQHWQTEFYLVITTDH
jgi:hypothetical protein